MVKTLLLLTLFTFSNLSFSQNSGFEEHFYDGKSWKYNVVFLRGWKVLIDINVKPDVSARMQSQLAYNLSLVDTKVPRKHLGYLRSIPIYISNETTYPLRQNEYGSLVFHHSRKWLSEYSLNPNMAISVHIINPKEVLDRHQTLGRAEYVILHELSHSFHFYKIGVEFKPILKAYKNAKINSLYSQVPSRNGDGRLVSAYAIVNEREYFAELSEAYFGVNDYFPKTRSELKIYDPVGFSAIEAAWK